MKKAGKIACPFLFLHLTPQEHGCGSDEFPVSFRGLTAVLPGGEDHSAADISGCQNGIDSHCRTVIALHGIYRRGLGIFEDIGLTP